MLSRRIDAFKNLEIIDVGNIRDKIVEAVAEVEAKIREVDLSAVTGKIGRSPRVWGLLYRKGARKLSVPKSSSHFDRGG